MNKTISMEKGVYIIHLVNMLYQDHTANRKGIKSAPSILCSGRGTSPPCDLIGHPVSHPNGH